MKRMIVGGDPETGDAGQAQDDPLRGQAGLEDQGGSRDSADDGAVDTDADEAAEQASVEKLQQLMSKKGVNDLGKLADMYSDMERKNTQLSQDVQRLTAATSIPRSRDTAQDPDDEFQLPDQPIDLVLNKENLGKFVAGLERKIENKYEKKQAEARFQEAYAKVQAKIAANPDEFQKLRPTMIELSRVDPNADIDMLYERAQEHDKRKAHDIVSLVKKELGLGDDVDSVDKLKALLGRARTAPLSSGTGQQVNTGKKQIDKDAAQIIKDIMNADRY